MTTLKTTSSSHKLVLSVAGLNLLMVLIGSVLSWMNLGIEADLLREFFRATGAIAYSIIGMLILTRQPRHMVGRLFLIIGFFSALGYLQFGLDGTLQTGFARDLNTWVGHIAWVPAFLIPITLVLLYFPDGQLLSKRWQIIPILTILGIGGLVVSYAFHPWPWDTAGIVDPRNPLAISRSESFFELIFFLSPIFLAPGLIGSLAAVVYRFRWAKGVERAQMKWVVYTAVLAVSPMFLYISKWENPIFLLYFVSLPTILASAIGIAILRYRLFDIDLIIRRTLQYSLLTGVLALIYYISVVVLQSLVESFTGEQSPLVIVLSTLAIAALFNPLRTRVQEFIDRRFYRKKYDAEKALAQFAATARDEVDIEKLSIALLGVVDETMQPEKVGLWLTKN